MSKSLAETPRSHRLILKGNRAAINTLPPEILAQIFLANIDPDDRTDRDGHKFLSRMKSVCWLWRDIALSTPALWTNINLGENAWWTRSVQASLSARLKEAFMRSRDASLDIVIDLGRMDQKYFSDMEIIITEDILPHLYRSRSLHLLLRDRNATRSLIPIKGQLPRLESLRVDWVVDDYPPSALLPRRIFDDGSAPELRLLHISGWLDLPLLTSVPLGSLRQLSLHARLVEPMDMTDVLMRCVNVEELDLESADLYMPSNSYTDPFTLPRLIYLCANYSLIAGFSRLISTPNLEVLSISWGSHSGDNGTVLRPLSQKLHTVVNLDSGHLDDPRHYVEIYEAHSGIRTISTTKADFDGILISLCGNGRPTAFDRKPSEPTLPILELLEFRMSSADVNLSFRPLFRVLEQRKNLRIIFEMLGRFRFSKDGLERLKERYGERLMLSGVIELDDAETTSG